MFEVEIIVWEGLEKLTTLIYLKARKKELSLRSLGIGAIGLSCVPPVSRATRYWVTRHWHQPSSRRCNTDGAKSFCPSLCKRPTGSSQPQLEYSVSLRHSDLWHGQYQYYINYICNRSFGFFFYFFLSSSLKSSFLQIHFSTWTSALLEVSGRTTRLWNNIRSWARVHQGALPFLPHDHTSPPLPAPLGRIIHSKGELALGGTDTTISLEGSASPQINLELSWDFFCLSNYPSHLKVRKPNLWDPETQTPAARVAEESRLMPHTVTVFLLAHEPLSSPSVK